VHGFCGGVFSNSRCGLRITFAVLEEKKFISEMQKRNPPVFPADSFSLRRFSHTPVCGLSAPPNINLSALAERHGHRGSGMAGFSMRKSCHDFQAVIMELQ